MSCSRNLCTLYTQNVSHNQQQPARLWHQCGGVWKGGMPRYRWKVWQNPFKPLKNSSTYFAFLHSLNEGISPFWFCFPSCRCRCRCSATNFSVTCYDPRHQQQQTARTTTSSSTTTIHNASHALAQSALLRLAVSFPFLRPCGGIKGFAAYQVINIYNGNNRCGSQTDLQPSWTSNYNLQQNAVSLNSPSPRPDHFGRNFFGKLINLLPKCGSCRRSALLLN